MKNASRNDPNSATRTLPAILLVSVLVAAPALFVSVLVAAPAMASEGSASDRPAGDGNIRDTKTDTDTETETCNAGDAAAASEIAVAQNQLIDFAADKVVYDSVADIVTATGNVDLEREGYRLQAETVVWNRATGQVTASGNIRSTGPNGETAYGDSIELTDTLKEGVVENLLIVLEEGSRIAAKSGQRNADGSLSLNYAAYTPCVVVGKDGEAKEPTWQVRATEVNYDPEKKRVRYKGARVELFGLPVIPLPGLSHPIGDQANSGFLVPKLGFSRNNGVEVEVPYYWRLAENRDLTASVTGYTKVAPLLYGRFRSLEKEGAFQASGYATYSRRRSLTGGPAREERDIRGYFDASGRFQLDPYWSISGSARLTSDRTFLRRYDISRDDRLRNNLAIERIGDDSYLSIGGWAVQTLRLGDDQGMVPIALPEIDYRLRLDDPLLGGKVQLQANTLAIGRTAGQDTQRAFASAEWNLRRITGWGQEVNFTLLGRGDLYNSDENPTLIEDPSLQSQLYSGDAGFQTRGIAAAAAEIKWPFVGSFLGGTQVLSPRVQIVAASVTSNLSVPNEDSRAVDLEDTNLFSLNRFPGYDRFEDNFRVTYGLDWKLRAKDFNVDVNIGQSFRLSNRSTILPDGTGLSEKISDIVGRTKVRFKDLVQLEHRYRLDKDSLAVRRNEVDATIGTRGTYLTLGYLRLNRDIIDLEDLTDREELRAGARVTIARYWSVFGSTIIDLTSAREDPAFTSDGFEPIRHRLGLAYDDDCLTFSVTWKRDYQDTGDAQRGNSYLFRLAFKNLGV